MAEDLGERTEAPTGRKLTEAREHGQVAQSPDLTAAIELIGAVILVIVFGAGLAKGMGEMMQVILRDTLDGVTTSTLDQLFVSTAVRTAVATAPVLALVFFIGVGAHVLQVGLVLSSHGLVPDLNRLNPANGMGRLFNRRQSVKALVNSGKLVAVVLVSWLLLRGLMDQVVGLPRLALWAGVSVIGDMLLLLVKWLLAIMLIIGVIDWMYQRWQLTQDLRMTKQEVQDERRSMDGDPKLKARRFKFARDIAQQRINQAVPQADVIVTNPTHFSVAIKYDPKTMTAPRVIAKGADFMAFRIRHLAMRHGVPIIERPPLARGLYGTVAVGGEISPKFYEAVAEVLAYVYRLEGEAAA